MTCRAASQETASRTTQSLLWAGTQDCSTKSHHNMAKHQQILNKLLDSEPENSPKRVSKGTETQNWTNDIHS